MPRPELVEGRIGGIAADRSAVDAASGGSHPAGRNEKEQREDALKAPSLAYRRAGTLAEALDLLAEHGEEAKLLAGGQSLVPALNMRLLEPRLLIDINRIAELGRIEEQAGGLRIGALVRQSALEASPLVARLAPLLHRAIPHIAHPAIRNRGTLGGSLAHADPAAELPACMVALDAIIELAGRGGRRRVDARDFFRGLYETALAPGEIVTAIELPPPRAEARCVFLELARRRGDYAIAGLAASAAAEGVRLVFFGIGTRPLEAKAAAAELTGGDPLQSLPRAEAALAAELDPAGDLQADPAMKRHLARVLLGRAVRALREAA